MSRKGQTQIGPSLILLAWVCVIKRPTPPCSRGTQGDSSILAALLLWSVSAVATPIAVRHPEGLVHGFLVLRAMDGTPIADGDLQQTAQGDRVTARLTFRFKDGSLHDETVVFSQRGSFRVLSDHLIQKGPSFPQPVDVMVDSAGGRVTVRYTDAGKQKVAEERLDVPPDLANGMMSILLKNVGAELSQAKVSISASLGGVGDESGADGERDCTRLVSTVAATCWWRLRTE